MVDESQGGKEQKVTRRNYMDETNMTIQGKEICQFVEKMKRRPFFSRTRGVAEGLC